MWVSVVYRFKAKAVLTFNTMKMLPRYAINCEFDIGDGDGSILADVDTLELVEVLSREAVGLVV